MYNSAARYSATPTSLTATSAEHATKRGAAKGRPHPLGPASYLSNWAASVEPFMARVEATPPLTIVDTASK